MVVVAQLVRASVCGTEGRRFEPGLPPLGFIVKPFHSFFEAVFFIAKTRARSASRDFGKPGLPPKKFEKKSLHRFLKRFLMKDFSIKKTETPLLRFK